MNENTERKEGSFEPSGSTNSGSSRNRKSKRQSKSKNSITNGNRGIANRGSKDATKDVPVKKNDYTFYAASDQIARDVASVPFNYLGGTTYPVSVQTLSSGTITTTKSDTGIPAIMTIEYLPAIGATDGTPSDGINMAAAQLYTKVRKVNSGAKNYEAPDLMMYVLAMRDIYANYFQAKKILGMVSFFNMFNHNLPHGLLMSNGITAVSDIRSNLASYRGRLNLIAKQINAFAVPSYFKVFDRTVFINSYVFTDSSSLRGQFYNYYKRFNYKWSGTTSTTGTELELMTQTNIDKFSTYLDNLQTQINAMFYDEDALTMSGDIAKAFDQLYTVNETPEDYVVPVTFDEDALAQIENMALPRIAQSGVTPSITVDANVTQANQLIKYSPKISCTMSQLDAYAINRYPLNSHKDNADYRDVLEWTRLMSTWDISANGEGTVVTYTFTSSGLEIPYNVYIMVPQGDTYLSYPFVPFQRANATSSNVISPTALNGLLLIQHFDWHPFLHFTTSGVTTSIAGDSKVITTVAKETLVNINRAAVFGALFSSN